MWTVLTYSQQTFGSFAVRRTDGTTSATTSSDIDIATPIKDEEEQAMQNKNNFMFGVSTTVIAALRKHKHRLHSCNQQQKKIIINCHWNNVPFFYNLTKIKRYPFMVVLIH